MLSPRLPLLLCLLLGAGATHGEGPVAHRAELVPLDEVRLLDGPFLTAQNTDRDYLLQLEPDRLLAWFVKEAGLPPKAENYAGWESRGIAGHSLGHYLSALAAMWQATGDERLRERVNYIVDVLAACQDTSRDGYVSAIPDGRKIFGDLAAGRVSTKTPFDLNGGWVPWYTTHKVLAGLLDAYHRAGNEKARGVAIKLADWCGGVIANLDEKQMQQMLSTEHGGMAESLAEISAITGDAKYLGLAKRFRHAVVFDPLARGEDRLTGLHANTQIPKIIGYERIYELTGEEPYGTAARSFWNFVVHDRSFATGGHGTHEHFFDPTRSRENLAEPEGPETCNTYNMLKLTERLFEAQPSGDLADYCERALYNHILGTQAPGQPGSFCYFTSMRPGASLTYSKPYGDFWCCVGTGMENHARYGEFIYARKGADTLMVNLFIPSELTAPGMTLRQETRFPAESQSRLTFTAMAEPKNFAVAVRCPGWTTPGGLKLAVNGEPVPVKTVPGEYAEVRREWKKGDVLTADFAMAIRTEPLANAEGYAAVFYGPTLLAGDLGKAEGNQLGQAINKRQAMPAAQTPVLLVASAAEIPGAIQPLAYQPLAFQVQKVVKPQEQITLHPFYETPPGQRYAIYWRYTSADKYASELHDREQADTRSRELEGRTLDRVTPGEQQPEVDHALKTEASGNGTSSDRRYRDAQAGGWFSYDVKTPADRPILLLCTYWGGEGLERRFDILVNGQPVASQTLHRDHPGAFFDVEYAVPPALTQGRTTATVKFQAAADRMAGGLFDLRVLSR